MRNTSLQRVQHTSYYNSLLDAHHHLQSLLDIQVRRWLVEHVHVSLLHNYHGDGESLQLTATEDLQGEERGGTGVRD
jgi:hypothetical protein